VQRYATSRVDGILRVALYDECDAQDSPRLRRSKHSEGRPFHHDARLAAKHSDSPEELVTISDENAHGAEKPAALTRHDVREVVFGERVVLAVVLALGVAALSQRALST